MCQPRDEESAIKLSNLLEFCHGSGDIFSKEKYKGSHIIKCNFVVQNQV